MNVDGQFVKKNFIAGQIVDIEDSAKGYTALANPPAE
jgi:hypothetical protein